ncbi:MAG: pseudouridine synthase [Aquabacterium sp.]|jgi:tRNA pseudouridine32 synthase/23S rRNA pseudouridine746 synthase|nr:MAG: pseudouridine synthase [Aquabacterium sp.]
MARHSKLHLPTREGVSPSCVALPSGPWPTVLDYLAQRLPKIEREDWAQRMARGEVLDADGRALGADAPYRQQTRVYYYRSLPAERRIPFEECVVYSDAHIVVADKPHFLPTIPTGNYVQETLLVRLKRRLGIDTLVPLHRLDRETAGLVLFSVDPATRNRYHTLFRERLVHKEYEAIAPLRADLPLPTLRRSRLMENPAAFMQMLEVEGEPNAETAIELLEQRGNLARYLLKPVTGQRHQLRVHLAALGRPIVGDLIYPVLQPDAMVTQEGPDYFGRPLQLLARTLAFDCPLTGRPLRFDSGRRLALPA